MSVTTMVDVNEALRAQDQEKLPDSPPWLWLTERFKVELKKLEVARGFIEREMVPEEVRSSLVDAAMPNTVLAFLREVCLIEEPVVWSSEDKPSHLMTMLSIQISLSTAMEKLRYQLFGHWLMCFNSLEDAMASKDSLPFGWASMEQEAKDSFLEHQTAGWLRDKVLPEAMPGPYSFWKNYLGEVQEEYDSGTHWSWSVECIRYYMKKTEAEVAKEMSDPEELKEHIARTMGKGKEEVG